MPIVTELEVPSLLTISNALSIFHVLAPAANPGPKFTKKGEELLLA